MSVKQASAWLASGQAPVARAREVALCLALLSGKVPLVPGVLGEGLGADLQGALAGEAEARGQWDLVALLKEHAPDKAARKTARKALFRAKQKGLWTEDASAAAPPRGIDLSRRPEPVPSYCTSFDGSGAQLVVLGGWSEADDAWCAVGVVEQRSGLVSTSWMPRMSRTRQRNFLEDVAQRFGGEIFEVPDGFAGGRLAWGLAQADAAKAQIRGDVGRVRRVVDGHEGLARCDATLSAEDEARLHTLVDEASALLDDGAFAAWSLVEPAGLRSLDAQFHERFDAAMAELGGAGSGGAQADAAEQDAEHVAARQAEAAARAVATCADAWVEREGADLIADRLTLTAFLLTRDPSADRRDLARRAVATARRLQQGAKGSELPLMRGWVRRIVASAHHHPGL